MKLIKRKEYILGKEDLDKAIIKYLKSKDIDIPSTVTITYTQDTTDDDLMGGFADFFNDNTKPEYIANVECLLSVNQVKDICIERTYKKLEIVAEDIRQAIIEYMEHLEINTKEFSIEFDREYGDVIAIVKKVKEINYKER